MRRALGLARTCLAARVVVDTPEATHESGDCIEAAELGWKPADVVLQADYFNLTPFSAAEGTTVLSRSAAWRRISSSRTTSFMKVEKTGAGTVIDNVSSLRIMR